MDLSNRFLGFGGARVAAEPLARARDLQRLNLSYNHLGVPQRTATPYPFPPPLVILPGGVTLALTQYRPLTAPL